MHAKMGDIARECGVSLMTVSRALANRKDVSVQTRKKVLAAAKRLNYEVNSLATNFANGRSEVVGIATPFRSMIGSDYFGEIVQGFQQVFKDKMWDFSLFDILSPSFDDGHKLEKLYRARRVDGLLVVAPGNMTFLSTLLQLRIPLVVIGESVASPNICSVACDDAQGIDLLCSHLFSIGHRRIAFVGGPHSHSNAKQREKAYIDFCRNKQLSPIVKAGDYTMESGRAAGLSLLKSAKRPTAIVAANDMMAFGVIETAHELKISVPDKVSVAGFDDLPMASVRFPRLTTVHQPVFEMAEYGARQLERSLTSTHEPLKDRIVLPVSLVIRESTKPIS